MGTKRRLQDEVKVDCAIVPQSLGVATATGLYYSMKLWNRALVVANHGPIATTATVKLEVFQAKDEWGTGSVLLAGATTTTLGTTTKRGAVVSITLATMLAATTVVVTPYVDGTAKTALTYTAHASTTTLANREFNIGGGTDTLDGDELVKCLNDSTYGVPGGFAINAAGVVTLYPTDDISIFNIASTPDDGTGLKTVPQGTLVVEVNRAALTWASGFGWICAKITNAVTLCLVSATLIRQGRYNPTQQCDTARVSV